jgi:hypothetical protein
VARARPFAPGRGGPVGDDQCEHGRQVAQEGAELRVVEPECGRPEGRAVAGRVGVLAGQVAVAEQRLDDAQPDRVQREFRRGHGLRLALDSAGR